MTISKVRFLEDQGIVTRTARPRATARTARPTSSGCGSRSPPSATPTCPGRRSGTTRRARCRWRGVAARRAGGDRGSRADRDGQHEAGSPPAAGGGRGRSGDLVEELTDRRRPAHHGRRRQVPLRGRSRSSGRRSSSGSHGVQTRHLRAIRAAADRQIDLIEAIVATGPLAPQRPRLDRLACQCAHAGERGVGVLRPAALGAPARRGRADLSGATARRSRSRERTRFRIAFADAGCCGVAWTSAEDGRPWRAGARRRPGP